MEQILFIFVLILFAGGMLYRCAKWYHFFRRTLRHLKGEIRRTSGEERKSWIRMKRRLWLSLLPFVRY